MLEWVGEAEQESLAPVADGSQDDLGEEERARTFQRVGNKDHEVRLRRSGQQATRRREESKDALGVGFGGALRRWDLAKRAWMVRYLPGYPCFALGPGFGPRFCRGRWWCKVKPLVSQQLPSMLRRRPPSFLDFNSFSRVALGY